MRRGPVVGVPLSPQRGEYTTNMPDWRGAMSPGERSRVNRVWSPMTVGSPGPVAATSVGNPPMRQGAAPLLVRLTPVTSDAEPAGSDEPIDALM